MLGDDDEGSPVKFSEDFQKHRCEAIVNSPEQRAKAVPYRPRRAALNWVDYLVIAAISLTFAAVVAASNPHMARAQARSTVIPAAELPVQGSQVGERPGMIKARIGLTLAGR